MSFGEFKMFTFVKLDAPMWPHPTLEKFDFDEFESTQSKVASTKVAPFLRKCFFLEKDFLQYIPL